MTVRQTFFLHHLLKGKTARQAALDAGYTTNTVNHKLHALLKVPALQAQLQRHLASIHDESACLYLALNHARQTLANPESDDRLRLSAARLALSLVRTLRTRVSTAQSIQESLKSQSVNNQTPTKAQPNYNQMASQPINNQPEKENFTQAELDEQSRELQQIIQQINEISKGDQPTISNVQQPNPPKPSFKQQLASMQRRPNRISRAPA